MAGNSMWCLRNVFKNAGKKGSRESNGGGGKGSPVHSGGNKSPSSGSGSSGDSGRGGAGDRGSKVLDPEEMEEQQRVNKLIEKQIKKDKRRFR